MTGCAYCNRPPDPDTFVHEDCYAEFLRRRDAGRCVKCDEADAAPGNLCCSECVAAGVPGFLGYPGRGMS